VTNKTPPSLGYTSFNPHPPLEAGATVTNKTGAMSLVLEFQSSPAFGGGCHEVQLRAKRQRRLGYSFNPHPPLEAGATHRESSPAFGGGCQGTAWLTKFQSSPAFGAAAVSILTRLWRRVPRGGQRQSSSLGFHQFFVSILTRLWRRVPHTLAAALNRRQAVSILTRLWRRVPRCPELEYTLLSKFQSSPAFGGGCHRSQTAPRVAQVSILTRLWRRVPRTQSCHLGSWCEFQSSPAFGGGCHISKPCGKRVCSFNPHPPLEAGATNHAKLKSKGPLHEEFQSSPAFGGGCHLCTGGRLSAQRSRFNPHPPLEAGATDCA
jgi:hypothetical protein